MTVRVLRAAPYTARVTVDGTSVALVRVMMSSVPVSMLPPTSHDSSLGTPQGRAAYPARSSAAIVTDSAPAINGAERPSTGPVST